MINVRKIYCTVDRLYCCKFSIEIIMVPLKKRMTTIFWKETYCCWKNHSNNGWLKDLLLGHKYSIFHTVDDCQSFRNRTVSETLLEGIDGYNYTEEINRLAWKRMPKVALPLPNYRKVSILDQYLLSKIIYSI